jgi:hypothetical protein
MADLAEPEEPMDATIEIADRRRANRRGYSNPHLISLLRQKSAEPAEQSEPAEQEVQASTTIEPADEQDDTDQLAPARGVGLGLLLGAAIWGSLVSVLWIAWVLHR